MSHSITTRKGDDGTTSLLFGKRVAKCHPQIVAVGYCDALVVALGAVKTECEPALFQSLETCQKEMVGLMGELATAPEDRARYLNSKMQRLEEESLKRLDSLCSELESMGLNYSHWATPGVNSVSIKLELARIAARNAERAVIEAGGETGYRPIIYQYLNRLSDWLWLCARHAENYLKQIAEDSTQTEDARYCAQCLADKDHPLGKKKSSNKKNLK